MWPHIGRVEIHLGWEQRSPALGEEPVTSENPNAVSSASSEPVTFGLGGGKSHLL